MWLDGFVAALSSTNILWLLLGTLFGLVIGVLPALGSNFGVALMLPFTFGLDPAAAMVFLTAVHASCNYGDSLSSILINVPGGPGTVATCWDGYPMAQQGRAGRALGIATLASFVGGAIAWFSLVLLAKPIGVFSMQIGAPEYFALGVMALSLVSIASKGETMKGIIMVCLGLVLASIGQDPVTGTSVRYSFGILWLEAGIPVVVSTLGIFAVSQIMNMLEEGGSIAKAAHIQDRILSGFWEVVKRPVSIIRAGIVGWFVGILPALGVSLAGISTYLVEKKYSKNKDQFGKGAPEGLVAAEVGKGACVVGDLIPTLTLGIPGSVTGAILMGALVIHGIDPGPRFMTAGTLPYIVFAGLLLGQLAYVIFGPMLCKILVPVITLPNALLAPVITILSFLGAFVERNYLFDLFILIVFGLIAYGLNKVGYPVVCLVLGLILGPMVEQNLHRSLGIDYGSPLVFLHRPISVTILAITVLFLAGPYLISFFKRFIKVENDIFQVSAGETPNSEQVTGKEILTLVILAVVFVTFIVLGRNYEPRVALFPSLFCILGLALIGIRALHLGLFAYRHGKTGLVAAKQEKTGNVPMIPMWLFSIMLLVFVICVYLIGFALSSALFLLAVALRAGYKNWLVLIPLSVGSGIFTLIFAWLLEISLPAGLLWESIQRLI
ncbi:tripartite tricarboxylate transporter permease [Candidatus Formimonas warabiya]|uniref:Tripartite tricarboxylate transporter permease n=1 Tax=Formimonas warabiya TaxID=1761012 RepID=A0A3G1KXH8_FORW1|nr:tripartite tricarboxylate transporter permease [Candidatus Formimonas warabiya]ATW27188.1 hypothetical protein DCMF_22725 [Candidatus Formimonas warabiya]